MIGDMQQPILSVRGLTTSLARSRATILEDISFSIAPGEVVGVVGKSGSGKSMLALSIMGLLPNAVRRTAGNVVLDGDELTGQSSDHWREKRGRDLADDFSGTDDRAQSGHACRQPGGGSLAPPPRSVGL